MQLIVGRAPEFQTDGGVANATNLAAEAYIPVSQSRAPGAYTRGDFWWAIFLCFVLIAIPRWRLLSHLATYMPGLKAAILGHKTFNES